MKRCVSPIHTGPNPVPTSDFYAHQETRDHLDSWCKACKDENLRRWRAANPERQRAINIRSREADPERTRENSRRETRKFKRANVASRGQAARHRYPWTGPELEIAARTDLTAAQVAALLGRTIVAVRHARVKLRTDPKTIMHAGLDDPADAITRPGNTFGPLPEAS
jgi:hypothetical protein